MSRCKLGENVLLGFLVQEDPPLMVKINAFSLVVDVFKVNVSSDFVFIGRVQFHSLVYYIPSSPDSTGCVLLPSLILSFTVVPTQGRHCQGTILHGSFMFMHVLQAETLSAFVLGYLPKTFILKKFLEDKSNVFSGLKGTIAYSFGI